MTSWFGKWLCTPLWNPRSVDGIEGTYAYKAGGKAYYAEDDFNPYQQGTESHRHWQAGYDAAQQFESSIW